MRESPTVSNSSCLIALDTAGVLGILEQLCTTIAVPDAVAQECGAAGPAWVQTNSVQNQSLAQSLRLSLGAGESEAILLSIELSAARLILDDKKVRRISRQLNLPVTGTLAVLLKAKERGIITRDCGTSLMCSKLRTSGCQTRWSRKSCYRLVNRGGLRVGGPPCSRRHS